ncbi:MAG: hypothetical protein WBG93_07425, partial [Thermoanaerobaculia bacterium]
MSRKTVLLGALVLTVILAGVAVAQETATETTVETSTGRIMHAGNETIIIDVKQGEHLGIRKFNVKGEHGIKFYDGQGNEMQVQDLREGQDVTAHRYVTSEVPVVVTFEEIEEIKIVDPPRAAAPAPAPAAAAAPAPAPAPEPAVLPSTGSPLPMILLLAVVMLAVA